MFKPIEPGQLRNRIVLQQAAVTRNTDGGEGKSWQDVVTVSAKITTQGGREFFAAKQSEVGAELTHEILIRFRPGVTPDMRIKYVDPKQGGALRYFDIRAVLNPDNEMRHILLLHVRELIGRQPQS